MPRISLSMVATIAFAVVSGTASAEPPRPLASLGPAPSDAPVAPAPAPRDTVRTDEMQTMIAGPTTHGGYGAPEVKISSLNNSAAVLVGAQGGWILNHTFVLGAAGFGFATPIDTTAPPAGTTRHVGLGYGGPRIGFILLPMAMFHASAGVLIGAGGISVADSDSVTHEMKTTRTEAFFALEPQMEIEGNVSTHVRVAIGGSYRYLSGATSVGYSRTELSGFATSFAVKFGAF